MALLTKDKRIRYQPAFDNVVTPVFALEVVPGLVEFEVAVPCLMPALR